MKVKNLNNASKRTEEKVKNAFAELLYEKKELNKITVVELVNRADITRSSFYTHYDSIYDVAVSFQDDIMKILLNDEIEINNPNDVYKYIDMLTLNVKDNEETYKMLVSSNEELLFFEKIRNKFINKACEAISDFNNNYYLKLEMSFFIDGVISQILRYFRSNTNYTIDELNKNIKEWFDKLFLQ